MISLSPTSASIPFETLETFQAKDPLLENLPVLVFYGFSTLGNSTQNSSRIQVHIYSLAGFLSFPRITAAPNSSLYSAVEHLPYDQQGDEVRRGLAIGLLSYFSNLSNSVKNCIRARSVAARFDETHAAELASRLVKVERAVEVVDFVRHTVTTQCMSWMDVDVVVEAEDVTKENSPYGPYKPLIEGLGAPTFLPTSVLKRAPSRPKAHNSGLTLTTQDKVALREEMNQLLDTERSYINKIGELVRGLESVPHVEAYSTFGMGFARKLRRIFDVNSTFFNKLDSVLEGTENEAINDIESHNECLGPTDHTGSLLFANMLLDSIPQFSVPYQEYLRDSGDASSIVRDLVSTAGPVSDMIAAFGEQRLRSVLIEPVQRLPRYSLILDNMVNLLPAPHPAVGSLLKAKDALADICSLDSDATSDNEAVKRLQKLVAFWPTECNPSGRLISAIDVKRLSAPFSSRQQSRAGIILLFTNAVVFIEKQSGNATSARGLLAEIDRLSKPGPSLQIRPPQPKDLEFSNSWPLHDILLTESDCFSKIRVMDLGQTDTPPFTFALMSPYEGKAYRFIEEVAKARTEGRISDTVRQSPGWALRSGSPTSNTLGILAAIFDLKTYHQMTLRSVTLSNNLASTKLPRITILLGDYSEQVEETLRSASAMVIRVSLLGSQACRIACSGSDNIAFCDEVPIDEGPAILSRRIGQVTKGLCDPHGSSLNITVQQIAFDRSVLKALHFEAEDLTQTKSHRPISPVKMLSSLIEKGLSNPPSPAKRHRQDLPSTNSIPDLQPLSSRQIQPSNAHPAKTGSAGSLGSLFKSSVAEKSNDSASSKASLFRATTSETGGGSASSKASLIRATTSGGNDTLVSLEATFGAYIEAFFARCGKPTAKSLQNRSTADELAVNELYNTLIEDPTRAGATSMVSEDVLLSAFEKFIHHAWKDSIGPLITPTMLESVQSELDRGRPAEFRRCFKSTLDDMNSQNRRAFCTIIKLLRSLLDASGNDGERGILTASFAVAIIGNSEFTKYINLVDRMVEDYEDLFGDVPLDSSRPTTSNSSIFNSFGRNRANNNHGSMTSNTSSFRRKFGLGSGTLTRENSQGESPSKVASVWRSLSKNARSPGGNRSQPSSISKGTLIRSLSTDADVRSHLDLRPFSQDNSMSPNSPEATVSSHVQDPSTPLSTIKEALSKPNTSTRRNRRSSLSDLNNTAIPSPSITWSPSVSQRPGNTLRNVNLLGGSPLVSRPTTSTSNPSAPGSNATSPLTSRPGTGNATKQLLSSSIPRFGSPARTFSPSRKENVPIRFTSPDRFNDSHKRSRIAMPKSTTCTSSTLLKSPSPSPKTTPNAQITATRTTASQRKELAARTRHPPNAQLQSSPSKSPHAPDTTTVTIHGSPHKLPPATSPPPLNIRKLPLQKSPPRFAPISTDPFIAKQVTSATSTITPESPRKLKLRSPSKLRARLSAEQRALANASTDLAAEMQAIGLEITASSSAAKINLATATDLQLRLKILEDRFSSTASGLTSSIESAKKSISESLTASERRTKKLERAYEDVQAENEALYERFNEELGKVLGRVRSGEGVGEMRKRIKGLEEECERLRRENGRLKVG